MCPSCAQNRRRFSGVSNSHRWCQRGLQIQIGFTMGSKPSVESLSAEQCIQLVGTQWNDAATRFFKRYPTCGYEWGKCKCKKSRKKICNCKTSPVTRNKLKGKTWVWFVYDTNTCSDIPRDFTSDLFLECSNHTFAILCS